MHWRLLSVAHGKGDIDGILASDNAGLPGNDRGSARPADGIPV